MMGCGEENAVAAISLTWQKSTLNNNSGNDDDDRRKPFVLNVKSCRAVEPVPTSGRSLNDLDTTSL